MISWIIRLFTINSGFKIIQKGTITVTHSSIFCDDWVTDEVLVIEGNSRGDKKVYFLSDNGSKRKISYDWITTHIKELR